MVYAVQAQLAFRNATRRDTVSTAIQTRLAQNVPFGEVTRVDSTSMTGDPSVLLTIRFAAKAEADAFWADAQAAVGTGLNGPVTGSSLTRHDCPHDGQAGPCVVSERRDW